LNIDDFATAIETEDMLHEYMEMGIDNKQTALVWL